MSTKYLKFLPIVTSFITFFFLETFFFFPKSIYIDLVLVSLVFLVFLKFSFNFNYKDLLSYFVLPCLFTLGIVAYSTMISEKFIIQCLIFLNILFVYKYFKALYLFLNKKIEDHLSSLENIFSFGNFLSFFFLSASLYGLYSHLNISIIILLASMLLIFILLTYNVVFTVSLKKEDIKNNLIYIIIFCVVLIELASVISFLPFNHNMIGLILAICYYMLIGLARYYLFLGKIKKKKIQLYLGFGFSAIFFILATAKWL